MARLFDDAQNEYLEVTAAVVSTVPFTMACWFWSDSIALDQTLTSIADTAGTSNYFRMVAAGGVGGDPIRAQCADGTTRTAQTSTGWSVNKWYHACSVFAAADDRRVYLDGGGKGTDANSATPAGLDVTTLGILKRSTLIHYHSGRIALATIWGAALTDGEVASLAAGWHPTVIRPDALVACWPLGGFDTNETDGGTAPDIWGGYDLTAFSDTTGPGIANHPGGLIYPTGAMVLPGAAGIVTSPWYYYQQQQVAS